MQIPIRKLTTYRMFKQDFFYLEPYLLQIEDSAMRSNARSFYRHRLFLSSRKATLFPPLRSVKQLYLRNLTVLGFKVFGMKQD